MYGDDTEFGDVGCQALAVCVGQSLVTRVDRAIGPCRGVGKKRGGARINDRLDASGPQQRVNQSDACDGERHLLNSRDGGRENVSRIVQIGKADDCGTKSGHLKYVSPRRAIKNSQVDAEARPARQTQDKKLR